MKKHIYDESNGLSYTLHGDYYLPDLAVNEEEPTYGKYGMLRKQFLKEHRPARYQYLLMTGELTAHLNPVGRLRYLQRKRASCSRGYQPSNQGEDPDCS